MTIGKKFAKYVSQNIAGMIGISLYILADTFFIAQSVGTDGITALNLVLPLYSLIYAIGAMIGVGSAIRFTIERIQPDVKTDGYFFNAVFFSGVIGVLFMIAGGFFPERIIALFGGDAQIIATGASYTKIFMLFTPFFMWNSICNAFVRNDGAPSTAMAATLLSSLFNIIGDYVLMFPLGMGMAGAALATALSPVVGITVCLVHFLSKKNTISLRITKPSAERLFRSCQVGVSAFVGEISSGVITIVFNSIILQLAGNIGVAAYGVVANTALVAVSMLNGISQGSQPLISEAYGKGNKKQVNEVLALGIGTALVLSVAVIAVIYAFAKPITAIFNGEGNIQMANYAEEGLRLYFLGFVFAGVNIVGTGALSATEAAKEAFVTSILRGFVAIVICAIALSALFGMTGVWLAFPAAEGITMLVTILALKRRR